MTQSTPRQEWKPTERYLTAQPSHKLLVILIASYCSNRLKIRCVLFSSKGEDILFLGYYLKQIRHFLTIYRITTHTKLQQCVRWPDTHARARAHTHTHTHTRIIVEFVLFCNFKAIKIQLSVSTKNELEGYPYTVGKRTKPVELKVYISIYPSIYLSIYLSMFISTCKISTYKYI